MILRFKLLGKNSNSSWLIDVYFLYNNNKHTKFGMDILFLILFFLIAIINDDLSHGLTQFF